MDDAATDAFDRLKLNRLTAVQLQDLESADPDLAAVRPTRTRIEYYFTATSAWILMALDHSDGMTTYVDADLHLFADPAPVFAEIQDASVAIVAHRFPPELADRTRFGKFNVGWLSFRKDHHARDVLETWRAQCLEWCFDRLEGDRFADQKYLDPWPERYTSVIVLQHPGINVAPWNVANHQVEVDEDSITIDGEPLIAFHFHGLRKLSSGLYDPNLDAYGLTCSGILKHDIYLPYIHRLEDWEQRLRSVGSRIASTNIRYDKSENVRHYARSIARSLRRRMSGQLLRARGRRRGSVK